MINGVIVDRRRDYTMREAAPILGVSYEMIKQYVHNYHFLKVRFIDENKTVINGDQIIYFFHHKADMMKRRRTFLKEKREEALRHMNIAEEWMKETPIDNSWATDKIQAIAQAVAERPKPAPKQDEDEAEAVVDDDNFYRD